MVPVFRKRQTQLNQEFRGNVVAPFFTFFLSTATETENVKLDLKAEIRQEIKHMMLCKIFCVCVYIIQI